MSKGKFREIAREYDVMVKQSERRTSDRVEGKVIDSHGWLSHGEMVDSRLQWIYHPNVHRPA
jgi:hypothetical protein